MQMNQAQIEQKDKAIQSLLIKFKNLENEVKNDKQNKENEDKNINEMNKEEDKKEDEKTNNIIDNEKCRIKKLTNTKRIIRTRIMIKIITRIKIKRI